MEQQPQASSSATTTSSSSPSSSQRRELQGPRPAPLRLRKDSHKIRKPPPPPGGPVQQVRQPVIIYTVSPKVVHAEPGEFMSVVQRLTGARSGTSSSSLSLPALPPPGTTEPHHHQVQMTSSSLPFPFPFLGGHHVHAPPHHVHGATSGQLLAPAAPHFPFQLQLQQQAPSGAAPQHHDHLMIHQLSPAADEVVGGGLPPPFPSILSPGSLPAIPPSFFSPPAPAYPGGGAAGISRLLGGLISPAFQTTGGGSNSLSIASIAGASSHQSVMSSSLQEASTSTTVMTPSPSAGAGAGAGAYYWDLFNNHN